MYYVVMLLTLRICNHMIHDWQHIRVHVLALTMSFEYFEYC